MWFPIRLDPGSYWRNTRLEIAISNPQDHELWMSFLAEVMAERATVMTLDEARRWDWMSMPIDEGDLRRAETYVG